MESLENSLNTNKLDINVETPEVLPVEIQEEKEKIMLDSDIDILVKKVKKEIDDQNKLDNARKELGLDIYSTKEEIRVNFDGDWTSLLMERMKNQATKNKFIASKIGILSSDAPYEKQNALEKEKFTKKYYYDQIRDYDKKIEKIFSFTTYVKSGEMAHLPDSLGSSRENGTVFSDATIDGRPLSDDEKMQSRHMKKAMYLENFRLILKIFPKVLIFQKYQKI